MGIKEDMSKLHGGVLRVYLQAWANRIKAWCRRYGVSPERLGYNLNDLESVKRLLLNFCDDLEEHECKEAIIEAIRESGGVIKPIEEMRKPPEVQTEYNELPMDIKNRIIDDIEAMASRNYPLSEIYELVIDELEDYEVPNPKEWAYKLILEALPPEIIVKLGSERLYRTTFPKVEVSGEVSKHEVKVEHEKKTEVEEKPKPKTKTKKEAGLVVAYGALNKYVIVGKPMPHAQEVSGRVRIGRVDDHKVYLIVPSRNVIVKVYDETPEYADVEVTRGWLEFY